MKKDNYTTQCDTCNRLTWYGKEQPCHCTYPKTKTCDTCGHTEQVEDEDGCLIIQPCTGTLRLI